MMTTADKITMVQTLLSGDETVTDDLATAYLTLAKQTVLRTLYPYGNNEFDEIPERYDALHCELAARYIARRGGLGEISHNENGINRTWGSEDDIDLLKQICPVAKVI